MHVEDYAMKENRKLLLQMMMRGIRRRGNVGLGEAIS
jgi:hypothetical protein